MAKKTRRTFRRAGLEIGLGVRGRLFLPSALLVAIRFEAFAAFVFRHLQTSFLLKISHGERVCEGSTCNPAVTV
jgi:hypothetical protein